ncbi:Kinesin-like protein KIN-4A [Camellia lanceoleosa]|uniref:Kinesin-like protein KIN-4A n=1 Tax=Camellia lanceoleosa TaxID=1840588 RepID=A0ACC0FY60_9ERIC|nr:Kinesin-like protein KIN-4A [Camellia lanceoleosa]
MGLSTHIHIRPPTQLRILDFKKKQDCQLQLLKQKQRSDEAAKRLQDEIKTIKVQKHCIWIISPPTLKHRYKYKRVLDFCLHNRPVIDQNLFYTGMKYTTATFATAMCNIVPAMFLLMAWILS